MELAPRIVRIYRDHELVAIHPRKFKPGERSTTQDHLPPDAQAYFMRDPQWCLFQARSIGPACHAVIESLFANRVLDNLRAAQGVIGLGESFFGRVRLEAACARAASFYAPKYFAVKKILHDGLDRQEQPQPARRLRPSTAAARASPPIFCTEAPRATHTKESIMNPMPQLEPMLATLSPASSIRSRPATARRLTHRFRIPTSRAHPGRDRPARAAPIRTAPAPRSGDDRQDHRATRPLGKRRSRPVAELATCRFVTEHAPILIAGPTGTGKSHLAQALCYCALRAGHDVLFITQAN